MTEVIQAVSGWCFNTLGLKRVEAATMINNPASQKVLLKNGFELEGYQKCFAEINGKFEDHYFFGLVASEFNSA
jgi:ribosomal-protein-alanine N-acetyltransferase